MGSAGHSEAALAHRPRAAPAMARFSAKGSGSEQDGDLRVATMSTMTARMVKGLGWEVEACVAGLRDDDVPLAGLRVLRDVHGEAAKHGLTIRRSRLWP